MNFSANCASSTPPTTVYELLTIQSFRDWAREQPLPEDEHLEVSRMVIWFFDLEGGTALYEKIGDPRGFHLVRDYFELLFDAIRGSEGAVVKTTEAALSVHRVVGGFQPWPGTARGQALEPQGGDSRRPCIAVTLNERLDYFGTSVNLASRLDGLARGGEAVLTEAVFDEPGIEELAAICVMESFHTSVRGLSQPLTAYRLSIAGADSP